MIQRLVEGKALFDGEALAATIAAADNNVRADALETLSESVLPLYDGMPTAYPEIVKGLIQAADQARAMVPVAIEAPYGTMPAKTFRDILVKIAEILTRYRYLDIDATFDALRTLYGWAQTDDERKPLVDLGESLAKHELRVWQQHGPVVQSILVGRIESLDDAEKAEKAWLFDAMLGSILGSEISGTSSSSSAVTLQWAPVKASEALRDIRSKAIALLKRQFALAGDDSGRRSALAALHLATRTPYRGAYTNALAQEVMDDTITVIEFETEVASRLTLELRRDAEDRVHRFYWIYETLPESMREDPDLEARRAKVQATALAFRDVANADPDFVTYKTLVGFNSVYPPAWDDREFRYEAAKEYRDEQLNALLATVEERDADAWYKRLSRYARTDGSDAATFPVFGNFLERLAEAKPAMVFGFIDRLEGPFGNFLAGMIAGLMRSSASQQALARLRAWIEAGQHLRDIAWYLRFADQLEEVLLCDTCASAIRHDDRRAVCNAMLAADSQFAAHPGTLIEDVFLPAVRHLSAAGDFSWVHLTWHSWLKRPIVRALDEAQARTVLEALVRYPQIDHQAEYIVASIALNWPAALVDFLGYRQTLARSDACPPRYDAVPYQVDQLREPLAAVPDIVLRGARDWFDADPAHFQYDGGQLIAPVFPELGSGLEPILWALLDSGHEKDLAFVLSVLSGFEGQVFIYPLIRSIVARLDQGSPLLRAAWGALCESGGVRGEFGFSDLYAERKKLLAPWLEDENETVRTFAADLIGDLDRWIASENRSAQASIALRRLDYGEDLRDGST